MILVILSDASFVHKWTTHLPFFILHCPQDFTVSIGRLRKLILGCMSLRSWIRVISSQPIFMDPRQDPPIAHRYLAHKLRTNKSWWLNSNFIHLFYGVIKLKIMMKTIEWNITKVGPKQDSFIATSKLIHMC